MITRLENKSTLRDAHARVSTARYARSASTKIMHAECMNSIYLSVVMVHVFKKYRV